MAGKITVRSACRVYLRKCCSGVPGPALVLQSCTEVAGASTPRKIWYRVTDCVGWDRDKNTTCIDLRDPRRAMRGGGLLWMTLNTIVLRRISHFSRLIYEVEKARKSSKPERSLRGFRI